MALFSEEMEKLATGIARERDRRFNALQGLHDGLSRFRSDTREQIGKMRTDMAGRAAGQKEELREFVDGLRCSVDQASRAAGARMSQIRKERERRRDGALRGLRSTVAGMRQESRRFLRDAFRRRTSARNAMTDRLLHFVDDLRSRVRLLLGKSRKSIQEMRGDFERGAHEFRRSTQQGPGRAAAERGSGRSSDETGLERLQLPERIEHALRSAGVLSVEDLVKYRRDRLLAIPGIGEASLKEIEKVLKKDGSHLKDQRKS